MQGFTPRIAVSRMLWTALMFPLVYGGRNTQRRTRERCRGGGAQGGKRGEDEGRRAGGEITRICTREDRKICMRKEHQSAETGLDCCLD